MRYRASLGTTTFLALLTASLLVACSDDNPPGQGKGRAGLLHGDQCERLTETQLQEILRDPPSCTQPGEVCDPRGTHCASNGTCYWQCRLDTDCQANEVCTCDGRCIATADIPESGVLPDPTCPKDPDLLAKVQPNDGGAFADGGGYRSCEFDDICPHGSFCDRRTGRCAFECQQNSDCVPPMGETAVCNCYGHCQTSAPPPVKNSPELPSLEVAPALIELPFVNPIPVNPSFTATEVELTLTTLFATPVDGGPTQGPSVTLHLAAGKYLDVSCPTGGPDGMLGGFAKECTIGSVWTWTKTGDVYKARTKIKVQPSAETPAMGETSLKTWSVKITSQDVISSPKSISLVYADVPAPADPAAVTSLDAGTGYRGVLEFTNVDQTSLSTSNNQPETAIFAFPVTALGAGGEVHILDPARSITSSGIIKVPLTVDEIKLPKYWVPESPELSGRYAAIVSSNGATQNMDTGAIVGSFSVWVDVGPVYHIFEAKYRLMPDTTVKSCAGANAVVCPSNFQCSPEGFCALDPKYEEIGLENTLPTVEGDARKAWLDTGPGSQHPIADALNAMMTQNSQLKLDTSNFLCGGVNATAALGFTVLPVSGSINCGAFGESDRAVPLITHLDTVRSYEVAQKLGQAWVPFISKKSAPELFRSCLSELARRPSAGDPQEYDPADPGPLTLIKALDALGPGYFAKDRLTGAEPVDDFSRDVSCVSLGNFFAILKAVTGTETTNPDYATRFTRNRLLYASTLRMWAEMHAFIARQAMQGGALDGTLSATKDLTSDLMNRSTEWKEEVTTEQVLDVLENGWSVLAGEANIISGFDSDMLAKPDPMRFSFPTSGESTVIEAWKKAHYDRLYGLAPALLEFEAAHMSLVEKYLQKINYETYEQSVGQSRSAPRERGLKRAGNATRGALILLDIAERMHQGAASSCYADGCFSAPTWEGRWKNALDEFRAARARLMGLSATMAANGNPLGIEENDLPLFFGDPMGTNSRFFASSDYLLNQWAIPAANSASSALTSARESWIAARNSVVQDTLLKADQERRIEGIQAQYGKTVVENCGLSIEAKDVFSQNINPQNCFVDPACTGASVDKSSANELASQLRPEILKLQMCKFNLLRKRQKLTFPPDVEECLVELSNRDPGSWTDIFLQDIVGVEPRDQKVSCYGKLFESSKLWGNFGQEQLPLDEREAVDHFCEGVFGHNPLPVAQINPSCFRGRMGEATSRIVAAREEVNAALARLQVTEVSANEQQGLCELKMGNNADRVHAHEALEKIRDRWAKTKKVARDVSLVTDTISSTVAMAGTGAAIGGAIGSVVPGPGTLIGAGVGAGVGAVVGFFKSKSNNASQKADDELRSAESSYQDLLQNQSRAEEIRACWGEYHTLRATIEADAATIEARAADVNTALIQLNTLMIETMQQYAEGKAAAEREKDRPFNGYAHHYWLSEKVDRFTREFTWAKRLTYLAMRAVEYDFQESLNLRTKILTAEHPDQLLETIEVLQQTQAARTINRRRPEESSVVVSIRDDVMRVADRSKAPFGERAWQPALRFRGRLSHPQFTVFDGNGVKLGQGIPFNLDHLTGTGTGGVALTHRCGERMWRVTATIQGDGLSDREPGAPVFLLKRNTFSSQWCESRGQENTLQTSSLQPSRQLFRPSDATAAVDKGRAFTAAVLYPWFNIRRADFYKKQYQEGASEELAGRGLYGDYVLLFPKELIDKGFPVDKVEDVLLRVDYLSIDNLPDVEKLESTEEEGP